MGEAADRLVRTCMMIQLLTHKRTEYRVRIFNL